MRSALDSSADQFVTTSTLPRNPKTMRYTEKEKCLWFTTVLLVLLHLCVFTAYRNSKNANSWSDIIPESSLHHTHGKSLQQRSSNKPNPSLGRVVYPNSVIRGGIRNPDEFKTALLKDSVVAAHFSDFRASRSRIVALKMERAAYVSYRIDDKVYWTKRKVKLVKGERLITDGEHYARARCGNRISEVSRVPTSPDEPTQVFLDTPIPFDDKDPLLLAALPKPASGSPEQTSPFRLGFVPKPGSRPPSPFIPPIIGAGAVAGGVLGPRFGGNSDSPLPPVIDTAPNPVPTADVPEPSTLLLLALGLGSALALRRRVRA